MGSKNIRIHYRRKQSYNTASNAIKKVRTPGGRITVIYSGKKARRPHCGDCGTVLHGLPAISGYAYSRLRKTDRTIKRAYGGSRCHTCVRNRIVRAFLIEEHKIVKRVKALSKKGGAKKK